MTSNTLENFAMKFEETVKSGVPAKESHTINYEWKIVWKNVIVFIYIHLATIYGLYLAFCYASLRSFTWCTYFIYLCRSTYKLKLHWLYQYNNKVCIIKDHLQFTDFSFGMLSGIGVTAGAHRLWCHRSYKAKWPMRLILIIFQTAALQVSLILIFYLLV